MKSNYKNYMFKPQGDWDDSTSPWYTNSMNDNEKRWDLTPSRWEQIKQSEHAAFVIVLSTIAILLILCSYWRT